MRLLGPIGRWLVKRQLSAFGQKHAAAHDATNLEKVSYFPGVNRKHLTDSQHK